VIWESKEYKEIKRQKQITSDTNTLKENFKMTKTSIQKLNHQGLRDTGTLQGKLSPKRDRPSQAVQGYFKGTLKRRKGIYVQRVSIRR
jgi:hypothetical protein